MATVYVDLGEQTVLVDGAPRSVACHLVSDWVDEPGAEFPPPPRPKKPRPAPQPAPSLKSIYQRFVGYGR